MGTMSEWLKIMLGEIARKKEEEARGAAEAAARQQGGATAQASPQQDVPKRTV
jgi:hypothetical protein